MLADKINSGSEKLFDAKQDVKTMQVELTAKNLELAEAQKVSAELLKEISASTAVAEKEKNEGKRHRRSRDGEGGRDRNPEGGGGG